MTKKIIAYDDDTREFVADTGPEGYGPDHTRNSYQARRFVNVSEAERWLAENIPATSFTLLETIDEV